MRPAAAVDTPPVAAASTPQQSEGSAKRIEPTVLPPAELKTPPVTRPREEKTPEPIAAKPATARDEKRVVTPAKEVAEETKADLKNQQPISTVIASAAKNEAAPQKSPVPTTTPKETVEEKGSDPKTRSLVLPSAPVTKTLQAAPAAETVKPAAPIAAPANQEKMSEKPIGDQLALLKNKPLEVVPEKKILTRPPPKALEGFIIQMAFNDKEKAQHWAEAMERRGFAISITEAGADGALRVRLGNFTLRDEAERQLRTFKQDGMNGIIINLPQAFRPEARSSIP
jgi:cell division protein FtsN